METNKKAQLEVISQGSEFLHAPDFVPHLESSAAGKFMFVIIDFRTSYLRTYRNSQVVRSLSQGIPFKSDCL